MRPSKVTTRVDSEIKASQVRLIGAEGEQVGIVSIREALQKAEEAGLNLVEISPNAEPPVCRIMDYGKYVFQLKKRKAMASKKQKQIQVKEIKLRPVTEEGDYQVKLRNLVRFLEEGNKAKVVLRFRGREFSHQELGVRVMQRLLNDLSPYGVVEQHPRLEGKQMVMILNPKKK